MTKEEIVTVPADILLFTILSLAFVGISAIWGKEYVMVNLGLILVWVSYRSIVELKR